jgi:hypothetical protein
MDNQKKASLKLKLSLKKETLRTLTESEQNLLDGVVGGTDQPPPGCSNTQCSNTNAFEA